MLNQIFLYVAYGLGAIFLVGGTILMIGILKPTKEKAAAEKEAKKAAKLAKEAEKAEKKKSTFGAGAAGKRKQKEFFASEDIGENNTGFTLDTNTEAQTPAFSVPSNNTPPKSSFQAAAFASKNGTSPAEDTAEALPAPNFTPPVTEEAEVEINLGGGKSVFGGGGFKLAEGSDSNKDSKETNRFGLPF